MVISVSISPVNQLFAPVPTDYGLVMIPARVASQLATKSKEGIPG
jgi:hypothetical protein